MMRTRYHLAAVDERTCTYCYIRGLSAYVGTIDEPTVHEGQMPTEEQVMHLPAKVQVLLFALSSAAVFTVMMGLNLIASEHPPLMSLLGASLLLGVSVWLAVKSMWPLYVQAPVNAISGSYTTRMFLLREERDEGGTWLSKAYPASYAVLGDAHPMHTPEAQRLLSRAGGY